MELAVLGPIEVRRAGSAVDLGPPKQRALLAALVLHVGRPVSADRLVELVWGELQPAAVVASLQSYVAGLRRVLEPERPARAASVLQWTARAGYCLVLPPDAVDAERFATAATAAHRRLGHAPDRPPQLPAGLGHERAAGIAADLDAALALWRGEPYPELGAAVAAERTRLDELRLVALEDRALLGLSIGEHATLAAELEPLAVEHPLRESLWMLRAQALAGAGRQADALAVLRALRRRLADDLGVDPGRAVGELEVQLLRQGGPPPRPRRTEPAPAAPPPDRWPLVGRDAELSELSVLVAAGRAGPQYALLVGEAGIGKTRLVEETARRAAAGGTLVLRGRCSQDEGAPPLWPWSGVLADLARARRLPDDPDLAPLLRRDPGSRAVDPDVEDAARFRTWDAVVRVLEQAAADVALLLFLDDLHWADPSSLRLLRHLVESVETAPITVVATRRPVLPDAGPLAGVGEALARRGALRLDLTGLSSDDVAAMVRAAIGRPPADREVAALRERTEGNAFFLVELVRLGEGRYSDVPVAVADVVAARTAVLPPATQEVLRLASVIGREADLALLAAVAGREAERVLDDLDPALAAGLVVEDGPDRFRFAHALGRDAVYAGVPASRRARRHAAVAVALDDAERVSEAARHWLAAGPAHAARAWRAAAAAAERATRLHGHEEAAALLAQALTAQADDPAATLAERYELLMARVSACRLAADRQGVDEMVLAAVAVGEELGDPVRTARAAVSTVEGSIWYPRPIGVVEPRLVDALRRVYERLPAQDRELRCRVQLALAAELGFAPELEEREALAAAGWATAQELGDPGLVAWACAAAFIATWRPATIDQRWRMTRDALATVRDAGDETAQAHVGTLHAIAQEERGDIDGMRATIVEIRELAGRRRLAVPTMVLGLLEAPWLALEGRFAAAERTFTEALAMLSRSSMPQREEARAGELVLTLAQGRAAEMVPWLTELADGSPLPLEGVLLLVMIYAGMVDEARARYEQRGLQEFTDDWQALMYMAIAIEVANACGLTELAARMYERMSPYAGRAVVAGSGVALGPVDTYLALAAATVGETALATRHAEDAQRLCERWRIPVAARWLREHRERNGY
jgi:DNA-binding SARP family transcriptional activator